MSLFVDTSLFQCKKCPHGIGFHNKTATSWGDDGIPCRKCKCNGFKGIKISTWKKRIKKQEKTMINKNSLAVHVVNKAVAKSGGKIQVNIAQGKEVIRITLEELAKEKPSEVLRLLGK